MDLRQLRYVAAVADAESFTQAAAAEFVVQSALSRQIRKLEQELGVRLFDRTTRSVSITAEGRALLPVVRQILAGVDELGDEAAAARGLLRGRVTVGLMEVPPEVLDIAAIIEQFHGRHPGIHVGLRSGGSDVLLQAVRNRELDLALIGLSERPDDDRLHCVSLLTEELVAVLPARHRLARNSQVDREELAEFAFIDFPPGYGLRHETDSGFAEVNRRVVFEVTRVEQVVQFVARGLGVALLPESVARSRAKTAELALVPIGDVEFRRRVMLVSPADPPGSSACQALVRSVEQYVAALDP